VLLLLLLLLLMMMMMLCAVWKWWNHEASCVHTHVPFVRDC